MFKELDENILKYFKEFMVLNKAQIEISTNKWEL